MGELSLLAKCQSIDGKGMAVLGKAWQRWERHESSGNGMTGGVGIRVLGNNYLSPITIIN